MNLFTKQNLRRVVYLLSGFLFLLMAAAYLTGIFGDYPVQAYMRLSGDIALISLLLSLSITPLRTVTGVTGIAPLRKAFGLNAFYYAALHVLIFIGLDLRFNFRELLDALGFRPFIWLGMGAFVILSVMAVTSIKRIKSMVKKAWKRIHSFVYLAGMLVAAHYTWSLGVNLFPLSSENLKPFIVTLILIILLALRLRPVKDLVLRLRRRTSPQATSE